ISLIIAGSSSAMAQGNWCLGINSSFTANNSTYIGGMSDAHALFTHNDFGTGSLGIVGRYFIDDHWSIQSGINFSSIGFDYSLAKNYSLQKNGDHFTANNVSIP